MTDPAGNQTVHTLSTLPVGSATCSHYETQTQYYQNVNGSQVLLKTVNTDFSAAVTPISPYKTAINVVPIRVTTTWPNGQVSKVEKDYDAGTPITGASLNALYGLVVEERDYDYGSAAGALLRRTDTSYLALSNSTYLANNLLALPSSISVYDGSGKLSASTTYGYDGAGLAPSGVTTQFTSGPPGGSARGNQTSLSRWLNTTGA